MQKPNCKCLACGKEYYFCLKCNQSTHAEPLWKVDYCSEDCKKVFEAVSSFNCGSITKEEAAEAIADVNVSELRPNIKEIVKTIQKDSKPAKPSFSKENTAKGLVDSKEESKGLMAPSKEDK